MNVVRAGDRVKLSYTTRSTAGGVIETSSNREPLEFIAGSDEVVAGISSAVIGMRLGEHKSVTVVPEQAFGHRDAKLERAAPAAAIPDNVREGDQLEVVLGAGRFDVWVQKLDGGRALLDANHPLAGEILVFDIEVVGIDTP